MLKSSDPGSTSDKLIIFIYVTGVLAITASILYFGWMFTWSTLYVPAITPVFVDMRTVQFAPESIAAGLNPQLSNPGDPGQRVMNYPIIWADIATWLNFASERNYLMFVMTYVMLFLLYNFFLLKTYPSWMLLMMLFSGSTFLAIERGNNDVLIYDMIFLAMIPSSRFWPLFTMAVAGFLKLYPIAAFLALVRNRTDVIYALIVFCLVMAINYDALPAISSALLKYEILSYGAVIASLLLDRVYGIQLSTFTLVVIHLLLPLLMVRIYKPSRHISIPQPATRLFVAGASVYLSTFIISNNWDYRLIFLILCIPYLNIVFKGAPKFCVFLLLLICANQLPLGMLQIGSNISYSLNILTKSILFELLLYLLLIQACHKWKRYRYGS
jgi:hypothetical protein